MTSSTPQAAHHGRRWLVLAVLGLAQLMVILDVTVVNIALPSAQQDLRFSDADRQWIVTAYTLAFGGLLLLAGRLADLLGRKRVFLIGLTCFVAASALGGAAPSLGLLIAARSLQGAFGALLAPAALSLLTATFTEPAERRQAFGAFGAIGVGGGAVGLLLGGALTEYLSWRWCLYINAPIALVAAAGALELLRHDKSPARAALDIPGTVTACLGLVALVYGFSQAEPAGWGSPVTLGLIVVGLAVLALFVLIERRVAEPLLPLRIILDRRRGGAFLTLGINTASLLAVFLFLSYYLQQNLGYSPVINGLAFLPAPIATSIASLRAAGRLAGRFGSRRVISGGMALAAIGMVWLAQLGPHSSYLAGVLPGLVVMSFGLGCVSGLAMATATERVAPEHAGAAGAAVNTMQQVGGSIGTALLSTLALGAQTRALAGAPRTAEAVAGATAHGYTTAFWVSAGLLGVGAVVSGVLLGGRSESPGEPTVESDVPVLAH
jgi:EmrB/QacA subfamily drug resistance transporter